VGDGWDESAGRLGALRLISGSFTGNILLTGNARIGAWAGQQGTISGVISDAGQGYGFEKWGNGRLLLTGASTYSGDTIVADGQLRLANLNGPALYNAVGAASAGNNNSNSDQYTNPNRPAGKIIIDHRTTEFRYPDVSAMLEFGADYQLGPKVDVVFDTKNGFAYMAMRDTTQEIGNISTGTTYGIAAKPEYMVLQNYEEDKAPVGTRKGTLIINQTRDLEFKGYMRNSYTGGTNSGAPLKLIKQGSATLTIESGTINTGGIDVLAGKLQIGDGGTVGSLLNENPVYVAAGAALEYFRGDNQNTHGTIKVGHNISGDGSLIFRSTGTGGTGSYIYTGDNLLTAKASFVVNNARLTVYQESDLGKNANDRPTIVVKTGGQVLLGRAGTYSNNFQLEGDGWLEPGTLGSGTWQGRRLGALHFNSNWHGGGDITLSGNILLSGNTNINSWDGGNHTISGVISGGYTLEKSGQSRLILMGANTYTGNTQITEGALRLARAGGAALYNASTAGAIRPNATVILGNDLSLGWNSALEFGDGVIANADNYANQLGANVDVKFDSRSSGYTWLHMLGTAQTIGNVLMGSDARSKQAVIDQAAGTNSYGTIVNNAAKYLTITQTVDQNYTGIVRSSNDNSGLLHIAKAGDKRLTLSGDTIYDGWTSVQSGVLEFTNTSKSSRYDIDLNAVLEFNVASGSRDMPTTSFNGQGILRKSGGGEIVWGTGAATFNLAAKSWIDIQGGTLVAGSYGNENWNNNLSSLNIAAGATFRSVEAEVRVDALTGAGTWAGGWRGTGYRSTPVIGVADGAAAFDANGVALSTPAGQHTFSGSIIDLNPAAGDRVRNLIKVGTGTQIFTGTNTYSGTTQIQGGVLQIGDGGTTGTLPGGNIIITNGSLVMNRSDDVVLNQKITSSGASNPNDLVGALDPLVYTVNNSTGSLVQRGTGTTTLTNNANDYVVQTNVEAGRLVLTSTNASTRGIDIASGAVAELATNVSGFTYTGGITYTGAGKLVRNAPTTGFRTLVGANGGVINMSAGGRIELVSGTLRLSDSAKTDWTSNKASLTLNAGTTLDLWDSGVAVGTGLNFANTNIYIDALDGSGSIIRGTTQNGSLTMGVANTSGSHTGAITVANGTTSLVKQGTGLQVLAGNNTYSGTTTIDGGTLQVGNGGITGTLGTGDITNNANLIFDRSLLSGSLTMSQNLGGTGDLTIRQSGGLIFGGTFDQRNVAIQNTGANDIVAFDGSTSISGGLTVSRGTESYNVRFRGANNSIAGNTTFNNVGSLQIGDASTDSTAFVGGVIAQAPSTLSIAGTISAQGTGVIDLSGGTTTVTDTAVVGGTSSGAITLANVTIHDGKTLTLGAGSTSTITTGAISGVSGGASSNLAFNTSGAVLVNGAIGTDIGTITVNNSGGATFNGIVNAASIAVLNSTTGSTVTFADNVTTTGGFNTAVGTAVYSLVMNGNINSIGGATTLFNTGRITLGSSATSRFDFISGLTITGASETHLGGTFTASSGDLSFGSGTVYLAYDTWVGGTSTGAISFSDIEMDDGVTLTLGTGRSNHLTVDTIQGTAGGASSNVVIDTTGAATINEVLRDIGSLTILSAGTLNFTGTVGGASDRIGGIFLKAASGDIRFANNVYATKMANSGGFDADFYGAVTDVTEAMTFTTAGTVNLGNADSDVLNFRGGITHTNGLTTLRGSLNTFGNTVTFGNLNASGASSINPGSAMTAVVTLGAVVLADGTHLSIGSGSSGAVNIASVSGTSGGTASDLTIDTTGNIGVSSAIGTDIGTVKLVNTGSASFGGAVSAVNLTIDSVQTGSTLSFADSTNITAGLSLAAGAYDLTMTGSTNTLGNSAVILANTGTVVLGDSGTDAFTLGGLTVTAASSVSLAGRRSQADGVLTIGDANTAVALSGNTVTGYLNNKCSHYSGQCR